MTNSSSGGYGLAAKGPQTITTESGEKIDNRGNLAFKEACQMAEEACKLFQMESSSANFTPYKDRYNLQGHIKDATEKTPEQ